MNSQEMLAAELRTAMESLATRVTEFAALTRGLTLNHVMLATTVQLDGSGVWTVDFTAPFAHVAVLAYGSQLTVVSQGPQDSAPAAGIGVTKVPAGAFVSWPMAGRAITLYGTALDTALVGVWEVPFPPMAAIPANLGGIA